MLQCCLTYIPNILSFLRIGLVPFLIAFLMVDNRKVRIWAVIVFVVACLTDYLDGYIARTFSQVSRLGKVLDPVADKLLIASTLVLLTGIGIIHGIHVVPAILIICREITLSGIREFLSESRVSIPVSKLAKGKTMVQMVSLILLLVAHTYDMEIVQQAGLWSLWIASFLSIITAWNYIKQTYVYIKALLLMTD